MKIFKYKIVGWECSIKIPVKSSILCVQVDGGTGDVCIWALVNEEASFEDRHFVIIPTGSGIKVRKGFKRLDYIGTFQVDGGYFVGHLFEEIV